MGNFTPGFSTWSGSSCPYFSHTILETLPWCVGLTLEREFILSQGTNVQNFRELSGKQICSDTERRARNPVDGSERAQSHHDTEWDEARGKSKSRSCAVIERDDGRINHNSYSSGVVSRSEWLSEKSQCVQSRLQRSRYTLSTLTEIGCLSSVRDLSPQKQTSCWQKHKICRV